LRHLLLLVAKDVRIEWRSRAAVGSQIVFTLLTVLLLVFALGQSAPRKSLAGLLWLAILFPGYQGLARSFLSEVESGSLDVLVSAPIPRPSIFFAKVTVNALLLAVSAAVAVPVFLAAFSVGPVVPLWQFAGTLLLGLIGFASTATVMAALSARTRLAQAALPLLVFPVMVPLLLGLVVVTGVEFAGGASGPWFLLIGLYDMLFLVVPALLFDIVLEV
jgi:heme exporter protein B